MNHKILAAAAVLALFAAFLAWNIQSTTMQPPSVIQASSAVKQGTFAASFNGTRPDGAFRLQGDQLVVDSRLLDFFDYYLAALGERSLEDIRRQIENELDHSLPPAAAAQAKKMLNQYIAYRAALVAVDKDQRANGDMLQALKQRLHAVRRIREQFFLPDQVKALFGNQQLDEEQALARLEIQQDANLSAEEKSNRLAQLDATLTPEQRSMRQQPVQHALVEQEVQAARKNGAGDSEIHQLRTQKLGAEAADRLAAVDKDEAQWGARMDAYLAARKALVANANLSANEREAAVQRLRSQYFSDAEQLRLGAYEADETSSR